MITQIKALKIAVEALYRERRAKYAIGHNAYMSGIRPVEINEDGISGVVFGSFESDHEKYVEYSEAIRQLEDLQEILEDEPTQVIYQLSLTLDSDPLE